MGARPTPCGTVLKRRRVVGVRPAFSLSAACPDRVLEPETPVLSPKRAPTGSGAPSI